MNESERKEFERQKELAIKQFYKAFPKNEKGESAEPKSNKRFDLFKMFNLESLTEKSDSKIILAIILLLSSENADELLILALIYILI